MSQIEARSAPRSATVLIVLLAATGLVNCIAMPRFWYPGDNFAARSETIGLVQHGRLGIDYSDASDLVVGERGQLFFWNDAKEKMYSKYGFGYTLLYLPPVFAQRALGGAELGPFDERESLLLLINLYNLVFAAGAIFYLYWIASSFEPAPVLAAAFVLAVVYPSFVWHYLRAPTLEVYQIFFFLGFCAHATRFLRATRSSESGRTAAVHLAIATSQAGMLLLLRPTFGILLPVLGSWALAAGSPQAPLLRRVRYTLREHRARFALAFMVPAMAFVTLWLAVNHLRTGSALDSGYAQWIGSDGLPLNRFTPAVVPGALRGFFVEAGNANVFLHQPLLLLALPLWPSFLRKHGREALLLGVAGAVGVATIVPVTNWNGEWCYGPRYLVHSSMILSVPAVMFVRALGSTARAARWIALATSGAVLAVALWMQIQVNSVHYFALHEAVGTLAGGDQFHAYVTGRGLRPLRIRELKEFVRGGSSFGPVETAIATVPDPERARARTYLRRELEKFVEPNWFWPHALATAHE